MLYGYIHNILSISVKIFVLKFKNVWDFVSNSSDIVEVTSAQIEVILLFKVVKDVFKFTDSELKLMILPSVSILFLIIFIVESGLP